MIIGIGTDLIEINRVEKILKKFSARFARRYFTALEQEYAWQAANPSAVFAKRYAAKEAFVKAVGTGFRAGIYWQDIEVVNNGLGQPYFNIYPRTAEFVEQHFKSKLLQYHLSLSDTAILAQAFVVICKINKYD